MELVRKIDGSHIEPVLLASGAIKIEQRKPGFNLVRACLACRIIAGQCIEQARFGPLVIAVGIPVFQWLASPWTQRRVSWKREQKNPLAGSPQIALSAPPAQQCRG